MFTLVKPLIQSPMTSHKTAARPLRQQQATDHDVVSQMSRHQAVDQVSLNIHNTAAEEVIESGATPSCLCRDPEANEDSREVDNDDPQATKSCSST